MGEDTFALEEIAAQLAVMLRVEGEKGREAWFELHGKLAEVASKASTDPGTAVQALLKVAQDAMSSEALEKGISNVNPDLIKHLVRLVADELDMTPLGDSGEAVHMVDEDSNFCEANVDSIIRCSAELSAPKAPYAVISIVGAQSSGKSYLLNRLFGTRFPEMDATLGWSQTTRGIMMSRCIGPSLLLLDVEGSDGRENKQDTLFENQSTLFALTISDLMIVNMDIADIGQEQGFGSLLFRTIFEERTKIEKEGLTKILVILRNYNGETPLKILRTAVQKRMKEIWDSVNVKSMKFKRYIEVDIFGMPDKASPNFPKEVTILRRLLSKNRDAKVPASWFTASSKFTWEIVKENKKLDIPSHQVLIASFYCKQVVEDILKSIDSLEEYSALKDELSKAEPSPCSFKKMSDKLLERIGTWYNLETKMYDPDESEKGRQLMVHIFYKIISDFSKIIILKTKEIISEQFEDEFNRDIRNYKEVLETYGKLKVNKFLDKFTVLCEDLEKFDSVFLKSIHGDLKCYITKECDLRILQVKAERERKAEEARKRSFVAKMGSWLVSLFVATE